MDATYNNTSSFKVTGDETTWLTPGTIVKLTQTGMTQTGIQSAVYSGGETIVTLHDAVVAADLSAVTTVGAVGLENGLSTHQHNRNPGSGGLVGINRMVMTYVSTTAITIGAGHYYIENAAGTKSFVFWSEADISYTFTSLGASQLQYLYADFSVIEDMDWWEVDATCFYNSTTAPTWDADRFGWYHGTNTDDICIWQIPTNPSSQIPVFGQVGDEIEYKLTDWDVASGVTLTTTPTNYASGIPANSRYARLLMYPTTNSITVSDNTVSGARLLCGPATSLDIIWLPTDSSGNVNLSANASGTFYSTLFGHKLGKGQ